MKRDYIEKKFNDKIIKLDDKKTIWQKDYIKKTLNDKKNRSWGN